MGNEYMSPEEFKSLIEEAISGASIFPWWNYIFLFLFTSIGAYFGSFLKKKGEISATKAHAKEIQKVLHQNQQLIEKYKAHNTMKLAAIDKRLQVHQEAYTLWKKLLSAVHTESIGNVVIECQSWWDENCLFLSAEPRKAFHTAFQCASNHASYLNVPPDLKDNELIDSNFKNITKVGDIIVRSVELPSLGDDENFNAVTKN